MKSVCIKGLVITVIVGYFTMFYADQVNGQSDAVEAAAAKENLEKVDGQWTETWVNPDVDFTQYKHLYLGSAVFDYRDVGDARRYRPSLSRRAMSQTVFGISEEDRAEFEEIVAEVFRDQISKGKYFTVVDSLQENTIIVRGAIADIISKVPPNIVGPSRIYLSSVGQATLAMEFMDAQTGEVLAVVAERGVISSSGGTINEFAATPMTPGSIRSAVKMWAANAAKKLRKALDNALSGSP